MHLNRTFGRQKSARHGVLVSWPSFEEGKREKRRNSKSLRNLEKKWRQFRGLSRYRLFFKLEYRSHAIRLTAARCTRPIVRKIYVTVWRLIYRAPMPFRSGQINVATKRGELYTINVAIHFTTTCRRSSLTNEIEFTKESFNVPLVALIVVHVRQDSKFLAKEGKNVSNACFIAICVNDRWTKWTIYLPKWTIYLFVLLYAYNATISYNT